MKKVEEHKTKKEKIKIAIFWTLWPILIFIIVQLFLGYSIMLIFGDNAKELFKNPIISTTFNILSYIFMIIFITFVPNKLFKNQKSLTVNSEEIGAKGLPKWKDVYLAIAGLFIAMILGGVLSYLAELIIPNFNGEEAQNVGFDNLISGYQLILAFITLVIAAPLAEEYLCRGVIYGKLRQVNPWFAMVIVSLMFGLAHGQWNVGITTFVMSLVMCFIREKKTKTIWSGVILHVLKNLIAFVLIFILTDFVKTLMME